MAVSFISSRQRRIWLLETLDSFVFMCHIPTSNDEAFCSYLTSLPPSVGMPNDRCPIFSKSVVLLWVLWGTTQLHNRERDRDRGEKMSLNKKKWEKIKMAPPLLWPLGFSSGYRKRIQMYLPYFIFFPSSCSSQLFSFLRHLQKKKIFF